MNERKMRGKGMEGRGWGGSNGDGPEFGEGTAAREIERRKIE